VSPERGRAAAAQEALEAIAILDTPAWAALCGLLSECPVLPKVLPAMLAGRASAASATAFASFSTRADPDGAPVHGPAAGPPAGVSGSAAIV
jgi:hypothetical protein